MRVMWAVVGVGVVSLACGGLVTPKGSERAREMAEYLSAEQEGIPCPVYVPGDVIEWRDTFEVVFESAEHGPPQEIPSGLFENQEKRWIEEEGGTVMTLRYTITNTSPVTQRRDFGMSLKGKPPAEAVWLRRHTTQLREDDPTLGDDGADDAILPGATVRMGSVYALKPEGVPGALVVLDESEERIDPEDPRGRYRDFPVQCAVVDLGFPLDDG